MNKSKTIFPVLAAFVASTKGFHGKRYIPQLPKAKPDETARLSAAEEKRQRKSSRRIAQQK